MFIVNIDEQLHSIQVTADDDNTLSIISDADYIFDEPDLSVLVQCRFVNIKPDDTQKLDEFLSAMITNIGQRFNSFVCIRLPTIFDNQIDAKELDNKHHVDYFMFNANVNCISDFDLTNQEDQYELITDKNSMIPYADPLATMIKRDAFWSTDWDIIDIQNRIKSATYVAMIFDKKQQCPCGFGRLILLKTTYGIIGYISDVVVDISHQSKGLGRVIINYLVGASMNRENDQANVAMTLCLRCAFKGSGAVSAPKLYKRFGFEFVDETDNRIALFGETKYHRKTHE